MPGTACTPSVAALAAAGLVLAQEDGAARYGPASPALDRLFEEAEMLPLRRAKGEGAGGAI